MATAGDCSTAVWRSISQSGSSMQRIRADRQRRYSGRPRACPRKVTGNHRGVLLRTTGHSQVLSALHALGVSAGHR